MNEETMAMKEKTRRMMKIYLASTPQERAGKVRAAMAKDRMLCLLQPIVAETLE